MTSPHAATSPAPPGRLAQRATRLMFFVAGFGTAAWAPLVPLARSRAGLDDGGLGLLLLCLGAGSILAMPMAGALAGRVGCRRVLLAGGAGICLTLPLLATVGSTPFLALVLFAFGAAVGSVDCVINIQAVVVERASGKSMMSGFHGLFSVGGIAGAAGVSALLGLGATPLAATLMVVAVLVASLGFASPNLLSAPDPAARGSTFVLPHGVVLFIGLMCFAVFLTEGAMLDWSAVFLTSAVNADPARAGLGYAAFAATMTAGRLTGDAVVGRLGGVRVIVLGGLLAAVGISVAALAPSWTIAMLGFALVGAGCSNIVPVLYTAVGRQTVMSEGAAVAAISTLGYAGILAGPAGIGFIAHLSSLPVAFGVLAVVLVGVAVGGAVLGAERVGRARR